MQNPQLYIFLLIIAFSVLQWIFRKVQEQRAIKKVEQAREREKLERLRTGRVESEQSRAPDTSSDPEVAVRTRLEELAERRRRQIEELRRRQAGGASASTTAAPPAGGQRQQTPVPPRMRPNQPTARSTGSPSMPTPMRSSGPVNKPLPTRAPQTSQSQQATARRNQFPMAPRDFTGTKPAPGPGPASKRPVPDLIARSSVGGPLEGLPIREARAAVLAAGETRQPLVGKLDRAALRRAIVLTEILGKPVALRDPNDRSGPSA